MPWCSPKFAAVFHLANHFAAARGNHAQSDIAVAQEDAIAFVNGVRAVRGTWC